MATINLESRLSARLKTLEEHIAFENQHDLDGIMDTFGVAARYDDEPWNAHYAGRDQVRAFYQQLLGAVPDLHIDVWRRHVASETIILEVIVSGQHLGAWRGLPSTGRKVQFPLCSIYTFDENDRLAGEKIYYDRATVLKQLGIFRDPDTALGRAVTVLTHPITTASMVGRRVFR